ncbi:MAG: enoyl-CoA hydratase/isomerase family protein [Rhodospirillaceae bacterium]|jgi:enoyl-CoA hydratase
MSDGFKFEENGAIGRLTFCRPERGNMLSLAMAKDLSKVLKKAGSDPSLKVIIIRGEGDDFCRGRDPEGAPEGKPTTAVEMRAALVEPLLGIYEAIRTAEIPVVTGVQGLVTGLGCGITAISDITIAADNSMFSMPEMRANLPPTLAMLAHLDRIPPKSLMHMVYSTEAIDAQRAVAIGLVSDVVAVDDLDGAVEGLLNKIADYERPSVVTCKQYLKSAKQADYQNANDLAGNMLSVVLSSRR